MKSTQDMMRELADKGLMTILSCVPKNGFCCTIANNGAKPFRQGRCKVALTADGAIAIALQNYNRDCEKDKDSGAIQMATPATTQIPKAMQPKVVA